jgi:uncharacterized protein (DUF427 family)
MRNPSWPSPEPIQPGQESVWDYPRPPIIEPTSRRLQVFLGGVCIADCSRGLRVLETSHPPTYYLHPDDFAAGALEPSVGARGSWCEWKGQAKYFDLVGGTDNRSVRVKAVAWAYPSPTPGSGMAPGYVALYAGPMDRCLVDGLRVTPQPGDFYGGWITSDVKGPFKGIPGSRFW